VKNEKRKIREEFLSKRLSLSKSEREKLSLSIRERVLSFLKGSPHRSFLFFYPIKGEPDLLPLASLLAERGFTVAFPKVVGDRLYPVKVSSLSELQRGKFGIPEPPLEGKRILTSLDVVFVPALAFDRRGYRVGYGGGFYDRFLKDFPVKEKVGICYSFQLIDKIPSQHFDVPVDLIITDKESVRRKEWNHS